MLRPLRLLGYRNCPPKESLRYVEVALGQQEKSTKPLKLVMTSTMSAPRSRSLILSARSASRSVRSPYRPPHRNPIVCATILVIHGAISSGDNSRGIDERLFSYIDVLSCAMRRRCGGLVGRKFDTYQQGQFGVG